MVHLADDLVLIGSAAANRSVVVNVREWISGRVRLRVDLGDVSSHFADAGCGNDIAGEDVADIGAVGQLTRW